MTQTLKIEVTGAVGGGKSTALHIIAVALNKEGYETQYGQPHEHVLYAKKRPKVKKE